MTEIAVKARFKHTLTGQKPAGGGGGRERQAFALRNLNKKYEQKSISAAVLRSGDAFLRSNI